MATWQEPVFDRTQGDVDYAKSQLSNGINNVEYKGCFNVTDINRIENNTRYLADMLLSLYYFNTITTTSSWARNSLLYQQHIDRIISNVSKVWSAWHKPANAPTLPNTLLDYEQVNNVEKNLYLLKEMLDNMVASFRECGTFSCGEE